MSDLNAPVVLIDLTNDDTTNPSSDEKHAIPNTSPKDTVAVAISRSASSLSSSSHSSFSNTPNTASSIVNPYARVKINSSSGQAQQQVRKFVGGAERARLLAQQKARKGPAKRIARPGETAPDDVLPIRMNALDRFFAALLRSSPAELLESESSDAKALALWRTICGRVSLTAPDSPIRASYDCKKGHFEVRAALVLEEARTAIALSLGRVWKRKGASNNINYNDNDNSNRKVLNKAMILRAHHIEKQSSYGIPKITFHSHQRFTRDELFLIRPGSLFQCIPREGHERTVQNVHLGIVVTGNRDQVEKNNMFTCLFFRENALPADLIDTEWVITPLCHLITELRAFEAMTINPGNVPFLPDLMGKQRAQHTRFTCNSVDDDNESSNSTTSELRNSLSDSTRQLSPGAIDAGCEVSTIVGLKAREDSVKLEMVKSPIGTSNHDQFSLLKNLNFKIPILNEAQEKAARSYLSSENGTVSLIQGPPGTGKTTLLVSVICRYLLENATTDGANKRRLMVCAPTNKAISVLASRFMAAFYEGRCGCCNPIMVGDADKLLDDERSNNNEMAHIESNGKLKSIFLYTWMQTLVEDYRKIKSYFLPGYKGKMNPRKLHNLSAQLEERLTKSLSHLSKDVIDGAARISCTLKMLQSGAPAHDIISIIDKHVQALSDMPYETVWTQLMLSADIIFCTLASAGGAVLKKTDRVHDLIVDEAAAATEPELCIPFHLQPNRLLVVGDPLQLPATVFSRHAAKLGLTKSLHERLMYECNFEHVMLDVQYRMSPEISAFPSMRFYNSKITDGENVVTDLYNKGPLLLDRLPYTFWQVNGLAEQTSSGSHQNRAEALKIVELVMALRQIKESKDRFWNSAERIRVITFYQSQVLLIKRLLYDKGLGNKIVVATVDSSQGCEADIVLISFVRSQQDKEQRHHAGFLADDRRMNVALTRAKYQLICVGNIRSFPKMVGADTMHLLAANLEERDLVRPVSTISNMNAHLDLFYVDSNSDQSPPKKFKFY